MDYKSIPERMIIKQELLPFIIFEEVLPILQGDERFGQVLEGWKYDLTSIIANSSYVLSESLQTLCRFFTESLYPNQPLTKLMIRNAVHNYTDSLIAEIEMVCDVQPKAEVVVVKASDNLAEQEYIYGSMNSDYQLMRDLVTQKKQFVETNEGVHEAAIQDHKGVIRGRAEVRPTIVDVGMSDKQKIWLSLVESTLNSLDEWTADLFDLISYLWIVQEKDKDGYINFHSDQALKLRFADAMKEDFYIREKERFSIMKRVAALSSIWVSMRGDDVTVIDAKKITDEQAYDFTTFSRMFEIGTLDMAYDKKTGDAKGIYSLQIRPSPILTHYLNNEQQMFGALDLKVFQYSHYTHREHKRLTRYLNYHWKIRTIKRSLQQPFRVQTLLDVIDFPKSYNGVQIRDRLESVLDDMQKDDIIKMWHYTTPIDESRVGKRFWVQKYWSRLSVTIVPPEDIILEHAKKVNFEKWSPTILQQRVEQTVEPIIEEDVEIIENMNEQVTLPLYEPERELTPELVAELIEKHGLTIRKAAAEMGMAHSSLLRYLKKENKRANAKNQAKLETWVSSKR